MNISKYTFLVLISVFLSGCTNDSESDLEDYTQNENVTYNGTVRTIISDNCIRCHTEPHQNGDPLALLTYDDVKNAVETRGLIDRISSFDPAFGMPFGGPRLPQSKIDQIIAWKNANFPE